MTRKPGRPTKLTPALQRRICTMLGHGVSKEAAARGCRVDEATFFRWQAQNREFREAVTRAEDSLLPKLMAVIAKAAKTDWRASLALAERKFPHELPRPATSVRLGGDPANPTPIALDPGAEAREIAKKLAGMTTEELRAFAPVRKPVENG